MPTTKTRLSLTLPADLAVFLKKISLRDAMPQAAKAVELLEKAWEIEEDAYFGKLADTLHQVDKGFVSHKKFWSQILPDKQR